MINEQLIEMYCITRFNAEFYTDKNTFFRHFTRVLEKAENSAISSYKGLCDNLDPRVSIRQNPFLLGTNPFEDNLFEQSNLETLLETGIKDVADLKDLVKGKAVFIKPNLNFVPTNINPYTMTDPRLLFALARLIHKYGAAKVLIGEKPGQRRKSFDSYNLLKRYFKIPGFIKFIEIDSEKKQRVKTKTKLVSKSLILPQSYLNADIVIDIPKMKTHTLTGVSLGIKNLFGLLTDKEKMRHHNDDINQKLVDLLSIRIPDLTIIDGLIGVEGQGPLYGAPRNSNLLVIGRDCVATDAVAAYLMGFNPNEITHIALAYQNGLGNINLKYCRFPAKRPQDLRSIFRKADANSNPLNQIEVIRGKDLNPGYLNSLSHSLERLSYEGIIPDKRKIYLGRFDDIAVEDSAIIFGDQTSQSVRYKNAKIIAGHPPKAFELYDVLKK